MMKEYKFKQLTKLVEVNFAQWNVLFDGEEIGSVKRIYHEGFRAYSKSGRYIGTGCTRHEAKSFVAQDFYGVDNIEWKECN